MLNRFRHLHAATHDPCMPADRYSPRSLHGRTTLHVSGMAQPASHCMMQACAVKTAVTLPPEEVRLCKTVSLCVQVYSSKASRGRGKAQATKHISFAPGTQDVGKPIPAVYGGSPAQQRQRPPPHVMDYTVKAGIRPSSQVRSLRRADMWHWCLSP